MVSRPYVSVSNLNEADVFGGGGGGDIPQEHGEVVMEPKKTPMTSCGALDISR